MASCEIRRAIAAEGPRVAEIYLASRHHAFPLIPRSIHPDDDVRRHFSGTVMRETEVYIAQRDGELVGFLSLHGDSVEHLYIVPQAQHEGVGGLLLEHAKKLRHRLELYAFQSNTPARRFYEARGFRPIAFSADQNEERQPDVLYQWIAGRE